MPNPEFRDGIFLEIPRIPETFRLSTGSPLRPTMSLLQRIGLFSRKDQVVSPECSSKCIHFLMSYTASGLCTRRSRAQDLTHTQDIVWAHRHTKAQRFCWHTGLQMLSRSASRQSRLLQLFIMPSARAESPACPVPQLGDTRLQALQIVAPALPCESPFLD